MALLAINDVSYNVEEAGAGPPLVLLHGFTGSTETWRDFVAAFGRTHRTIAIDLLGHGQSAAPKNASRYSFHKILSDLVGIADALDLRSASWLGYSMGGRLALGLAIEYPARVGALILESASPGITNPVEREQRRASDRDLAVFIEHFGVPHFVDSWEKLPLWESQARIPATARQTLREQRLRNDPIGLAGSLRGMGTGSQPAHLDRLSSVDCPTLLIAGALDAKFSAIAASMDARLPHATLAIVPDAGHAVHLEAPVQMRGHVCQFLYDHRAERSSQGTTGGLS